MRSSFWIGLFLLLTMSLTGCFKKGNTSSDLFLGVVTTPPPPPPLKVTAQSLIVVVGTTDKFTASGGQAPYVFSVISGGGSFAGSVYTAPTTRGPAQILATDAVGATGTLTITINPTLSISPSSPPTIAVNDSILFTGVGGLPPYSYSVVSGFGTFSGGNYTASSVSGTETVQVKDAAGTIAGPVTITINPALQISPAGQYVLTGGTVNFSASGGVGPYTYSVVSGGGSLAGTVYTAPSSPGTAIVRATDSLGNISNASLTINMPLSFTPSSATVAINGSTTFSASGGIPPYTYSVIAGGGTFLVNTYQAPGAPGSATVQVMDAASTTRTATVTINPALAITPTTKTMVTNSNFTFAASGGVPPYFYSVLSGGGSIFGGTYTSPSAAGSAVVKVQDAANSSMTASVTILSIASVSAGSYSTCVSLSDGSARCRGNNGLGQLGNGATTIQSVAPVTVTGLTTATALASDAVDVLSFNHSCALTAAGGVQCWGDNTKGELGNGTIVSSSTPVSATGITTATQVSTGYTDTCARLSTGALNCWGENKFGEVGDASVLQRTSPTAVSGIANATAVSTGYYESCAVLATGAVNCWGLNSNGQLGNGNTGTNSSSPVAVTGITTATAVSVGYQHACALLSTGVVKCWGAGASGQLGNGATADSNLPVSVTGVTNATAIGVANGYSCALLSTGSVQCWGTNSLGQLGAGGTYVASSSSPVTVSGITTASAISVGGYHACALLSDNTLHCWGGNGFGEIGNGTSSTYPAFTAGMTGLTTVSAVSLSPQGHFGCAQLSGGTIQCAGNDYFGQLGDGIIEASELIGALVGVSGITTATQVAAGGSSACALISGGTVKCWGYNLSGQLGNGTTVDSTSPVSVSSITTAAQVAAGGSTACAVLSGGAVNCWGKGANGALGNGAAADSSTPVAVSGISTATIAVIGNDHGCALLSGGTVQCWGNNLNGQLGNGVAGGTSTTPVAVTGITTATALAATDDASCALLSGGTVKCWGAGAKGELGNGGSTDSATAVAVTGITTATAISGGQGHFCALLTGGTVQCWGSNVYAQLGNGTVTQALSPVTVTGLSGATSISAGASGTCARISATSVNCWGTNALDEFGLTAPSFGAQLTPVTVVFP